MTVHFDQARERAQVVAEQICRTGVDVILIRDLVGRLTLVVDGEFPADTADRFRSAVGAFVGHTPVVRAGDLFDPGSILESPDLFVHREPVDGAGRLAVLERSVVGADWARLGGAPPGRRTTLYGFKGGVGRSTATMLLAKHVAELGKCVLVVDLDLESPGVGALLQQLENSPPHGLVDHLVEAAVNNADELELVSQSRVVAGAGNGEVWVAPASGRPAPGYDYLAKLNRVYSDLPPDVHGNARRFGDRLDQAITACEEEVARRSRRPDVVLLDSRAGIHDIAAVAITRLSDLSLLFAADNPHTWEGYRILFRQWQRNLPPESLDKLRRRLRMVASMVPSVDPTEHLERFRDNAQQCFAETLYDDNTDADDLDSFNFAPQDSEAPHFPLPILFNSDLVGLDPALHADWHEQPLVMASYRNFLLGATELLIGQDF